MGKRVRILIRLLLCVFMITGCASTGTGEVSTAAVHDAYSYAEYPLERNGISLHLDCMKVENTEPEKNILLVHGSTYSSHEFDIDYEDYSLVRRLASEGFAVWPFERRWNGSRAKPDRTGLICSDGAGEL